MTDTQIIDFLKSLSKAGAELTIGPIDWLNPECGYYAKLNLPSGNAKGVTTHSWGGQTGIEAVVMLAKHGPVLPSSF